MVVAGWIILTHVVAPAAEAAESQSCIQGSNVNEQG
jgi:hypothetical protein